MNRERTFEQMLNHIEEAILSGKLKPGDKILPERKLQAEYNISRGPVREALRILEQKGQIEIRKGSKGGAFVKEIALSQVSETLDNLMRHGKVSRKHRTEFRETMETAAAGYAAERVTSADIVRLKEQFDKLEVLAQSKKYNFKKFYHLEMNMHFDLARISGNPLFQWISKTFSINLRHYGSASQIRDADVAHQILIDWQSIIEAMERGEVMLTRALMNEHIVRYRKLARSLL